ncbi:MAG: AI-2E family transporter [Bacteroidota bacterium]|nr:AI-2E family transporter [Bacteroidota bacterium]
MTTTSASIIKKLLVLFLVFAGLHFAKEFLMPIAIGTVLATLFLPFCKWMERKKVPKALATFICLLVLLLGVAGIGALLGWQISELINDFELIKQKALELANRIQLYIFNHLGITADKQWQLIKDQQFSFIGIIPYMASSMASILGNFILILVYLFGLLYFRSHIKQFILKLATPAQREEMEQVVLSTTQVSQQYLIGLAKMIACLWIMYGIGFSIIGVKNALFFAVLCGLLEIVPFIGNIIGTSLTLLVAAVQGASLPFLGGIVLTYGIVQLIQGWLLEPMMVGPQVKINPLFTIIALILGELVWGIPGIFLAIPLTAMFKIVCDHFESLKPFGFLIGKIEAKENKKIIKWIKKVGH